MSNMREAFPGPGELLVIPVDRALPAVIPKRKNPEPIRKKRNRAVRGWAILSGALMVLCMVQWVAIYLMLPSVS